MDIGLLFKIAGVGFIVMVVATALKQSGRDDQGQMVTLVGLLVVLMMVVTLLGNFFSLVQSTFGMR
ncbi:MAG TPA: stage III sporulation protein AC [Symbiobacteriaceae bacterium]|nr:stage III sporulation protein AC [Symbiobacteriaceae bacterium]